MVHGRQVIFGITVVAAALISVAVPAGLEPRQAQILAIVLVSLGLWATALIPAFLTALIFFTALLIGGLADPDIVFSGFTSAAIWLVLSGFVIGAAISSSGLGPRLSGLVTPYLSQSYIGLIAGLVVLGAGLGFLMPSSTGRTMVMVPLAMALADALGFERNSTGRIGVALAVALSSNMPSFAILPANLPNIVLTGAADKILGIHLGYADYLFLHYPVLGLVKSAAIVFFILRFYPTGAGAAAVPLREAENGGRHRVLLAILITMLLLWATDGVHGVPPAWIGLAIAVLLLMPRIGFVSPQAFREAADFSTLLMVAGVLALGTVVSAAGLGEVLARFVLQLLPLEPGRDFMNFVSLSILSVLTSLVTTAPGVPAVLTPLVSDLSAATGFSTEAVLMTQVIGFSTVILPYQAPPLIVAMGLAGEPMRALARVMLAVTILTLLVLVPLDFLWWKLLGWI